MRGNRTEKKMLMFAACCAAIVFGGYMTFFHKEPEEKGDYGNMQEVENMTAAAVDYRWKELPDTENESADEFFSKSGIMKNGIFFTNPEILDKGNLPLEAQAVLAEDVREFLDRNGYDDVIELRLQANNYIETADKISFICFMNGYQEALQVEYVHDENCLKYYILPDGTDMEGNR